MNSAALQQGGMGLILTVLMVSVPPMAAAFFQGVLGQFSSYNQMAGTQAGGNKTDPLGRPLNNSMPGQPASTGTNNDEKVNAGSTTGRFVGGGGPMITGAGDTTKGAGESNKGVAG